MEPSLHRLAASSFFLRWLDFLALRCVCMCGIRGVVLDGGSVSSYRSMPGVWRPFFLHGPLRSRGLAFQLPLAVLAGMGGCALHCVLCRVGVEHFVAVSCASRPHVQNTEGRGVHLLPYLGMAFSTHTGTFGSPVLPIPWYDGRKGIL